jgi:hypothetical protein
MILPEHESSPEGERLVELSVVDRNGQADAISSTLAMSMRRLRLGGISIMLQ